MGKDDQPKYRQAARELRRRAARRQPADRLLIVCEGAKTEPLYLGEIRQALRLPTANVQVQPAAYGTEPLHVVNYAEALFLRGDRALAIAPRCFDRVIAVFDRDEHHTYHAALAKAAALDRHMTNDEKARVPFETVVSVPCFELWLLLHFEDVLAPLHRDEALQRLQVHLPGYSKGQSGHWAATQDRLDAATARASALAAAGHNAHDGHALSRWVQCGAIRRGHRDRGRMGDDVMAAALAWVGDEARVQCAVRMSHRPWVTLPGPGTARRVWIDPARRRSSRESPPCAGSQRGSPVPPSKKDAS